jgi:hypothetical protein
MGSPSFWRRLLEKLCPHRFSWPHTGGHGQDYQVCLICGSVYEYDCINMRRTGRLLAMAGEHEAAAGKPLGSRGV